MQTDTFVHIWALLNPQGEFKRREQVCRRLWASYDMDKQRDIYNAIRGKQRRGEFVNQNPYFAIEDNAVDLAGKAARLSLMSAPTNYFGRPLPHGVTFYRADYQGVRGLYTEQDVLAHHMSNPEKFEL